MLAALLVAVVTRADPRGLVLGLALDLGLGVALVLAVPSLPRVRRRRSTVLPDRLVVQRDRYRLVVPWDCVTDVRRRRRRLAMVGEELACTGARVEPVDSRDRSARLPRGLSDHPARSRVLVRAYARHWREGPIGDHLPAGVLSGPDRRRSTPRRR